MDDRAVDLLAENIDVALRLGVQTDSALNARRLAQAERLVVASADYLTRRGVPRTPADLFKHDGIIYGQSTGGQGWLFRRGTSETSLHLKTRLKLSAAEGVREAVLAGQGFAIASRWMFERSSNQAKWQAFSTNGRCLQWISGSFIPRAG